MAVAAETFAPQHNRDHRTIGYRSEPVSARFETESQAAPRRSLEFRPQKPRMSKFASRGPRTTALAVGTVSIKQQPLVAMRLELQRLRSGGGA